MIAIDTHTNKVIATIQTGQQPQALVYVPGAVPQGDGTANLTPLGEAGNATHLTLVASPPNRQNAARASVSVNSLGALDLLQMAVSGLKPGQSYRLWLVSSRIAPFGNKQALTTFKTNIAGAQVVQAVGPLRQVLTRGHEAAQADERFLLVTEADNDVPQLVQGEPIPTRGP